VRAANGVIAATIALFALSLAHDVPRWDNHFRDVAGIGITFVVPSAAILALLAAFRLAPARRQELALLLVSVALPVYGMEATLAASTPTARSAAAAAQRSFDDRSVLDVVLDLRAQGVDAYPSPKPKRYLDFPLWGEAEPKLHLDGRGVLPLAGITDRTIVTCNEGGSLPIHESDEVGFRNPKGLWRAGAVEIVAIGDSFTYGCCVETEESIVGRIRARHPATLNLGMGGNGPLIELATLREYGPALRPRLVLWFFYDGNDLQWNLPDEMRSPLLMAYLEDGFQQGLLGRREALDAALADFIARRAEKARQTSALWRRLDELEGPVRRFLTVHRLRLRLETALAAPRLDYALFRRIVAAAQRSVSAWGGELVFVYLPGPGDLGRGAPYLEGIHERVGALLGELGIRMVDLREAFRRHGNPSALFYYPGSHFSPAGARVAARGVLEALDGPESRGGCSDSPPGEAHPLDCG
jgi:hypothetical protein